MKKFLALLLVLLLVVGLVGCAEKDDPSKKSQGVMTYAQYAAAPLDSEVTIEAYVQATQAWWSKDGQGVITVYAQDADGGYFIYEMPCSEADAAKLVPGTKLKVTGYKAEWSGEVEIIDPKFEILKGNYVAKAKDVTAQLGTDDLKKSENMLVAFKGMTVEASEGGKPWLYKWNGSGSEGDDLYFNVSLNGQTYTFTVESYLCGSNTDVYKAVKDLKVGDKIDMEGFLYWYEGANPHITKVTPSK